MYINGYYTNRYFEFLESELAMPLSSEEIEKTKDLIQNNLHLLDFSHDLNCKNQILQLLDRLAELKPSFTILGRIFSLNHKLKFAFHKNARPHFNPPHEIVLSDSFHFYINGQTHSGEKMILRQKPHFILLHECVHVMHYLESPQENEPSSPLLHQDFEDEEEQITISGIHPESQTLSIYSENGGMYSSGAKIARLDHQAVSIPKGEILGPIHWAGLRNGLPLLQKCIDEWDNRLNRMSLFYDKYYPEGIIIRPLTVALFKKRQENALCLLTSQEIEVSYFDQMGNPIALAIKQEQYDLVALMIQHSSFRSISEEKKEKLLLAIIEEIKEKKMRCQKVLPLLLPQLSPKEISFIRKHSSSLMKSYMNGL